jgi:predicted HAD superfamily hydrolase/glycosyltransferase involved in cell wall biosynthesis
MNYEAQTPPNKSKFECANAAFKNKDYKRAVDLYRQTLEQSTGPFKEQVSLNLQRALRHLSESDLSVTVIVDSGNLVSAPFTPQVYQDKEASPSATHSYKLTNLANNDSDDEKIVRDSGFFDSDFYLSSYPEVKKIKFDPIRHYCRFGWIDYKNPNSEFTTEYYLSKYSDVCSSGMNPFVHWIKYGRHEKRYIKSIEVLPYSNNIENCPSLVFISHDASQTGAPAVLLTLMQWVKKNTRINFSIIVGRSGPWNKKFEVIAPTFFMDAHHRLGLQNELRNFCGNHVKAVYINTIASALYAEHLKFLQAEFVTHVHEMEYAFTVFQPCVEVLKQICSKYIAVSQGSIDALKKRFNMSQIDLKFLKPFIDKKSHRSPPVRKHTHKKVVFGCGTVEMRKGFDLFCVVASTLKARGRKDFHFYWIGSDTNTDLVASKVIDLHGVADVVEFMGIQDYPRDFFAWGDIFLLPSREDPYPLVCMEAAECDIPVVCFDEKAGGMHSFVEEDAGVVVPYLDTEAMADALAMFMDNEHMRDAYGRTAHKKVKERHHVDIIAPQILEFLPKSIYICDTTELESYKRHIENAKAISFDIFDTLVTRKLHDPNVVFDVIEYKHTKNEAAPLPLFNERMQTAGRVLGSYSGQKDDITIDEIYKNMSFYKNSYIEKQTEIQMCVTHPIGKALYDYAKQLGKRIIIASDMYLDKETVQTILNKNGFDRWDAFYLSSEQGKKKDTGKLFEQIKVDAKRHGITPHEILHIGDNWTGDVKCARAAGLEALRFSPIYEKKHKIFELDANINQLSQIGKIWNSFSIQAARLWRESQPEASQDFYTRLGFELTGPLAAMMAMHTKALADKLSAKKIVFMARDGRIIKKAFDALYAKELDAQQYHSDYLHLSRATVIPATFEHPLSSNDIYFLTEGLHLQQKPVSYFVEKANLDIEKTGIKAIIKKYFKSPYTIAKNNDIAKLASMFGELSHQINDANEIKRKALQKYLVQHNILEDQSVILVDVGWMLNIQSRLDRFIKSMGSNTKVVGSYVGSRDRINKSISHASLLFDGGDPYMYAQFIEKNVTLFEVLFSSPEPAAASIELVAEGIKVYYKALQKPIPTHEFLVAQKLHLGAEAYFEKLTAAKAEFFPEKISKDYFFKLFEALVNTDSEVAKATLGNFEVMLGGHHEFFSNQPLLKTSRYFEYKLKQHDEYFKPINFEAKKPQAHTIIVTSAGLDNGSTRYRAIHLADALCYQGISSTLIHAATPMAQAEQIIQAANSIIFQRCFEEQGNVGKYLEYAKEKGIRCIAETDDLVFPAYVHVIGSVKGGQWPIEHAMKIATAYENLIKKTDACIVSTPLLKNYIEQSYKIPAVVVRNKVTSKRLKAPKSVDGNNIKLIYASGTYSHKEDFDIIEAVLYEFMATNKHVSLSILGAAQVTERLLALQNVSNYPLLPYTAMLDFIAKHDLMLVPLVDDVFNRAKSSVKFVECGGVGVPVLASKVGEFDFVIEHMENGLLATGEAEWARWLTWVAENPQGLEKLAQGALKLVSERYITTRLEDDCVLKILRNNI